jgi:hypothetical protein
VTLLEIIEKLDEMNREETIYAVEPWSPDSAALVTAETQRGVPNRASEKGMAYFLEVFIARDFLEDWQAASQESHSSRERCRRLIEYAINDA